MTAAYIIAEVGVNHNGSVERAREMIAVAAAAGVDAVKFQTFTAKELVTSSCPKADYQKVGFYSAESQFEMLQRLELSPTAFENLQACCETNGIEFLSTPFDLSSIEKLASLGVRKWKLPSGELTNLLYLKEIGRRGGEVILSTGMSEIGEIGAALQVLEDSGIPCKEITLLHCTSEYPTPMEEVNLRAMHTMRSAFPGIKGVGYSDHTLGIEVPIAAVSLGATVIEKHFTLDRRLPGPDHRASLEPPELESMVRSIRNIELALGDGSKVPSPSELKNRAVARKSIVANRDIDAGEIFTAENLTVKRPGTGISPMQWEQVIGRKAKRAVVEEELIDA